ncbi:hypothetical protein EMIT0P201_12107 [Pseudomonas chlororaphis]
MGRRAWARYFIRTAVWLPGSLTTGCFEFKNARREPMPVI